MNAFQKFNHSLTSTLPLINYSFTLSIPFYYFSLVTVPAIRSPHLRASILLLIICKV